MRIVSFLCILGFFAMAAIAGDPPASQNDQKPEPAKEEKTKEEKAAVPGGAGMVVTIDPERGPVQDDGQMSEEMREALAEMINTSSEGLKEVTLADGTVIVDLKGRFRSAMVATIDKDGKVRTNCLSSDPKHKHADSCSATHKDEAPKDQ